MAYLLLQWQLHKYTPKSNLINNYVMWYTRNLSSISHTHKPHKSVKNTLTVNEMTLILNTQYRHVKDQW